MKQDVDVLVVGGGIIGLAVARELRASGRAAEVLVVEKDDRVGSQQSGHNSGVVHAGLYYRPGSLKAQLCTRGRLLLQGFCAEQGVRYEACGKVVVATDREEEPRLAAILASAQANGVPGVRRIGTEELVEIEPHVRGHEAVWSPETAIVDFPGVCDALATEVRAAAGEIALSTTVVGIDTEPARARVTVEDETGRRAVISARSVILCGGLQADRLAVMAGGSTSPRIVPFRGEYFALRPQHRYLVRGLVYPVPDPRYPFLGIHLTKHIDGGVLVGPNAILALAREGYRWRDVHARETYEVARSREFRALARRHWRTGAAELWRSLNRRAFVAAARRFVPELGPDAVVRAPAGVRAQAVDRDGSLVDDFVLERFGPVFAVRNAPSPAATSSLAIAEHIVERISS